MRLRTKIEIAFLLGLCPLVGIFGIGYGSYKTIIWSYGGRDGFRQAVVREPMEQEWYKVNPSTVIGRATPLADVPKYLDTPGHGDGLGAGEEHPHARNY